MLHRNPTMFVGDFRAVLLAPTQSSYMCRLRLPNGMLNAWQLATLADLAERYAGGCCHITTRANIQMREIAPSNAVAMVEDDPPAAADRCNSHPSCERGCGGTRGSWDHGALQWFEANIGGPGRINSEQAPQPDLAERFAVIAINVIARQLLAAARAVQHDRE